VLDSGGFSELAMYGRWTVPAAQYVAEVRRYAAEIGRLRWAAAMDWMCEPEILRKTGLSVADHQRRTLENYLELRIRAPEAPWAPVLQGWAPADYWRHADAYRKAGVDLSAAPAVGVGSVCRRQRTAGISVLLAGLQDLGARLHVFGLKTSGLRRSAGYVTSADSLAWSYAARRWPPLPECGGAHVRCNNCLRFALRWRERLLETLGLLTPGGRGAGQAALF
jgi:hypothetical protein